MGENIMELIIPKDMADLKLPAPELVDLYADRENRVIYVDYDIDDTGGGYLHKSVKSVIVCVWAPVSCSLIAVVKEPFL